MGKIQCYFRWTSEARDKPMWAIHDKQKICDERWTQHPVKMLKTCQTFTCFTDEKHEADDDSPPPPPSPSPLPSLPCVHSTRLRVYHHHAHMLFQHVRVVPVHKETFWTDTYHTPHRTPRHNTTQHDTPHHTTTTRPQHHTETAEKENRERREDEREREKEKRDRREREGEKMKEKMRRGKDQQIDSASWPVNSFLFLRINKSVQLQFSIIFLNCLVMQLQFSFFQIFLVCAATVFFAGINSP